MKRWSSNRSKNSEIAVEYTELCNKMKEVCVTVANAKPVVRSRGSITWETFVKGMERLARRNPKIFFRPAKAFHLFNPPPRVNPLPMRSLMELLLCVSPFSTRALDGVSKVSKDLMMPAVHRPGQSS